MKRYILTIIIAIMALGAQAQNADVLTLDSCFALAKANNAQFKTNQLEIEKAREVKAQVFTKFFPQVSAGYLVYNAVKPIIHYDTQDIDGEFGELLKDIIEVLNSPEIGMDVPTEVNLMKSGRGANALAIQPVFAGGRIVNGNRLAKLGIEAAELKAEVSERDLLENIESTYLMVVGLKEKVQTVASALTLIDSLDHSVAVALEAGLVTKNDALRVALKRNELEAKQLQLSNGIILASKLLCQQIGIAYPEGGLNLQNDVAEQEEQVLTTGGETNRPEQRLLQLQVESEKYYKKLTIGEALPQIGIGVFANYGNIIQENARANAILFGRVSIPLTQWWETSHKIKEHNIKIKEAELMQEDLSQKMVLQEQQAYNQMIEAQALLRSDKSALAMAEENYRLAELNYRAGMNTLTDVLEANALLLQAQNAITDRQISYITARRRYHDLTGK